MNFASQTRMFARFGDNDDYEVLCKLTRAASHCCEGDTVTPLSGGTCPPDFALGRSVSLSRASSCSIQPLQAEPQKQSSAVTPFPAHFWGDFCYLSYRTFAIVGSMILIALISGQKALPGPDHNRARSEIVTPSEFSNIRLEPEQHAALVQKVSARLRMLRLVVERLPKHFTPYRTEPDYKLTYYVEKLSCGHEHYYFPQAGPMTERRKCAQCALEATLPEKKPAVSVTLPADQEKRA
jgi:hypothetical protein